MKKSFLYTVFILLFQLSQAQETKSKTSPKNNGEKNIQTTVITLDLSNPNLNSINHNNKENKLAVKTAKPLAFRLINGNPFRFKYILNFKKVNLFTNENFNPSVSDLNSESNNNIKFDTDNDGIPDDLDLSPNTPNPITKDIVIGLQSTSKKKLVNLKANIESYIFEISDDSKLDSIIFNSKKIEFKKSYLKCLNDIIDIEKKKSSLSEIDFTVNNNQSELESIAESIRKLIEKLYSTKYNSYLLPIDINGENIDYVEIQLDVYDGDNEIPETYKYKVWIKGGVKIDISGGVHITSLFDSEYYTTDINGTEKLIHKKDIGNYDFGFGTMVNVSLRGGSWIRPALNFGVLFTSNQKFQMLTGFGLILGKNERIILHGGISMGRVSVLDNNYSADGATPYSLGVDGSVPLVEKFKFGNFFGITYNFGKPKSNKD